MAGGKREATARDRVEAVFAQLGLAADTRAEEIAPNRFVELEQAFAAG
jgi:16S rRNA A1518/A1519 N6-dimethyltransferase RsmA/KsgA/DIM1 with predicted DNA glycosylase/AP lyase activity